MSWNLKSITNLKKEMRELEKQEQEQEQQKERLEENKYRQILRSRSVMPKPLSTSATSNVSIITALRISSLTVNTTKSHRKREWSTANARSFIFVPEPLPPKKIGNVGRKTIVLSSLAQDNIRYVFYQILSEKIYPSISTLLARLQKEHPDFPIRTESTLLKTMKQLGFKYRVTSRSPVALE